MTNLVMDFSLNDDGLEYIEKLQRNNSYSSVIKKIDSSGKLNLYTQRHIMPETFYYVTIGESTEEPLLLGLSSEKLEGIIGEGEYKKYGIDSKGRITIPSHVQNRFSQESQNNLNILYCPSNFIIFPQSKTDLIERRMNLDSILHPFS